MTDAISRLRSPRPGDSLGTREDRPFWASRNVKIFASLIISIAIVQGMSKGGKLPSDEFARRRAVLLNELRELNAIAVIHSAAQVERNNGVDHPYRQESNFYYLTGWVYPDAVLVLSPKEDESKEAEATLFVPERDIKRELWTGPRPGVSEAGQLPEINESIAYKNFFDYLPKLIEPYERLVISCGGDRDFENQIRHSLEGSYHHPQIVQEANSLIKSMRLFKSDFEITAIERAIDITGASLLETLPKIPDLKYEYEVQAEIEYGFKKRGVERFGFPSIVGSGKNATFLHYEDNKGALSSGELILMDIGAEWDYYSADITRTVPVSGRFSSEQAKIYQLVLDAQMAVIQSIRPGVAFKETNRIAIEVITNGLVDLGLLSGDPATLIAERKYKKFFMHGTSHWLGLDVHDVGGYLDDSGEKHKFKAGMVITVEPGIYIQEAADIDPKWWNIGVRIEDDVLITDEGHRILSAEIPKTIAEIEAIMNP
ncbi:MAG: aminopeptidase P N-terminal domain-containing protein [Candidatus Marinimicrobia bacterium]|nr:aminopeptidase P N-terminal domain-containing protein [Candidatus Neomarinimicrobiota bacterium]